jgi:16S rRNA (guanine527-N7)-methyltransferase
VLDDDAVQRFVAFAALLERWRRSANLIACATARELVDRHLLDSLACTWPAAAARNVADLGSGAGFPGVPLAIAAPTRRTLLVEPRRRRASFLREVRRVLELPAIEIIETRAEHYDAAAVASVDAVVSRAVWSRDEDLEIAVPWIRPGGVLIAMRASGQPTVVVPHEELVADSTLTYTIGRARRRLEVFRRG